MRRSLFTLILFFVSTAVLAQSDIASEMAALRQLVENQSRLLTEQSSQLDSLTRRVAELEGRPDDADAETSGLVALESDDVPPRSQTADDTTAIEAGDTALKQKKSIRSGKESVIVEDNVALSDTMNYTAPCESSPRQAPKIQRLTTVRRGLAFDWTAVSKTVIRCSGALNGRSTSLTAIPISR